MRFAANRSGRRKKMRLSVFLLVPWFGPVVFGIALRATEE
jgi:hypothetical protein